jgi:ankyrin repeat protein
MCSRRELTDANLLSLYMSYYFCLQQGNTALHFAAKWGYLDMVAYLVESGAEINFKNDRGRTALHLSTSYE